MQRVRGESANDIRMLLEQNAHFELLVSQPRLVSCGSTDGYDQAEKCIRWTLHLS